MIAKKHLGYKVVVCGKYVEFYDYKSPIFIDYERNYNIVSDKNREDFEKRDDNLYRARKKVRQIIWSNITKNTKLLTLTYKDACLFEADLYKDMKRFIQNMKRNGVVLKYLYILERQIERGIKEGNEGSLHVHMIIFNDEKIPVKMLEMAWGKGFIDIHILNGLRYVREDGLLTEKQRYKKSEAIKNAGAYICKYIGKENQKEFKSRTYKCSLGLKKPIELNFYTYKDESGSRIQYVTDYLTDYYNIVNNVESGGYREEKEIKYKMSDGTDYTNVVYYRQSQIKEGSDIQSVVDKIYALNMESKEYRKMMRDKVLETIEDEDLPF